ncbi:MAG: hypothetical protein K2K54_05745 [Lachnospiraceae bacterium]|nr:hypothetical protein [Lachnospiraceae bacterium]
MNTDVENVKQAKRVGISEKGCLEALTRSDCTEMTKVSLRKILNDSADYFYSDIEYKAHKGADYTRYI